MRRILFLIIALVLVLSTVGTAFAQEPSDPAVLGDVWLFWSWGRDPGERVDVYLYRPSTLAGWPFATGPWYGTWWMDADESDARRQSWPASQTADELGFYFAEFMLPRDEVWYPCSFPYKWNCNFAYYTDPFTDPVREFHSPVILNQELGLLWPWVDSVYYANTGDFATAWAMANPQDTVAPMEAWFVGETGTGIFAMEVVGYYWKWSDFNGPFEWVYFP